MNVGVILLYWIFLDPFASDPPTWFSSEKLNWSSPVAISPLRICKWYLSRSLSDFNSALEGNECVVLILFNDTPFNSYGNICVLTVWDLCIESTPLDEIPNVPAGEDPAVIEL